MSVYIRKELCLNSHETSTGCFGWLTRSLVPTRFQHPDACSLRDQVEPEL